MDIELNGHNGTEIVKVERTATTALEPNSVNEAFFLAQKLVASGLLGKSIQKPESALAVILAGRELGLTTMQSLRSIHIIEGRPTLSADLMVALVKRSPKCKYFKMVESTAKIAVYETYRHDEGVTKMSFTIEQAHAAGVAGKDNWKKWPDAMLRARCIAALARAVYPDLLAGVYETDELQQSMQAVPPVQVQYQPVEVSSVDAFEESDSEKVDRWSSAIKSANTDSELLSVGKAIKGEPMQENVRLQLSKIYGERKKALKEQPVVEVVE